MAESPKFPRHKGNRVEDHDGDVRFWTGSGNIALSIMRHASGHNYRNSSFIVDVAMGQIPRSTERVSSYNTTFISAFVSASRGVPVSVVDYTFYLPECDVQFELISWLIKYQSGVN